METATKTKKVLITKHDIIAKIAYYAIRQSPYTFPKNLQVALAAIEKRIDEKAIFEPSDRKNITGFVEIDEKKLYLLIKDLIFKTPEVAIWNLTQFELDKGFTDPDDPNRPVQFGCVDRTGNLNQADHDFIDLDALAMNVNMMFEVYERCEEI